MSQGGFEHEVTAAGFPGSRPSRRGQPSLVGLASLSLGKSLRAGTPSQVPQHLPGLTRHQSHTGCLANVWLSPCSLCCTHT